MFELLLLNLNNVPELDKFFKKLFILFDLSKLFDDDFGEAVQYIVK